MEDVFFCEYGLKPGVYGEQRAQTVVGRYNLVVYDDLYSVEKGPSSYVWVYHDMWICPLNRMMSRSDLGIGLTVGQQGGGVVIGVGSGCIHQKADRLAVDMDPFIGSCLELKVYVGFGVDV